MKNKYNAFLSHNNQDKPIVEQIAQWLELWDLNGKLLSDLNLHTGKVLSAVFSHCGTRILTASADGTAKI
jgi:WD40 repeat protein